MRSHNITHRPIGRVLWLMTPESVRLRWEHETILTIRYFGRGNETFCCIEDKWFHIAYHWVSYLVNEEEGYDWYVQVDWITEVVPPTNVIYSHTLEYPWEYDEPISARMHNATNYIGCDRGDDLRLFP
ncbi:hypothetical protein H7X87_03790 [Acetobacteraceae bacterium]|nr:hypothetical protein [Candidatus Parcubacteria bacterium]